MLLHASSVRRRGVAALAYDAAILADGPLHYWRMSEISGTAVADLGSANIAGVATGATRNTASLVPSNSNPSITLAGAGTSGIDIGAAARFSGTQSFSVECTFRIDSYAGNSALPLLICAGSSGVGGWYVMIDTSDSGGIRIRFFTQGPTPTETSSVYASGDMTGTYHLVCVKNGSTVRMYLNGAEVDYLSQPAHPAITAFTTANSLIGAYTVGATNQLSGAIDDVAVFNYALTEVQILAHAAARYTGINTYSGVLLGKGPRAYWKFDEPSGTQCLSATNFKHLTTQGTGLTRVAGLLPSESINPGAISLAGAAYVDNLDGQIFRYNLSSYSFVVNPTDLSVEVALWHCGDLAVSAQQGTFITITSAGKIFMQWFNGAWQSVVTTGSYILANTTAHIFLVFASATSVLVYVNGAYKETLTLPNACAQSGYPARIGARKNATMDAYFKGIIDACAYFTRAVSATDIAAIYAAR